MQPSGAAATAATDTLSERPGAVRAPSVLPVARYLPEIDGLRGVAIALIVVYHVWFRRVSGGVDVFLLLSGFLITWSLVRAVEQHGRIRLASFYARIVRRIFPPALVVLIGVVVATVVWLPQARWRETLTDVAASALYFVNWHLADNAVDYLASQNAASPVQHYWSLAIQGQFYLVWPLLLAVPALVAARFGGRALRAVLLVLLGTVFAGSLAYSIQRTATDQIYTYFDTFARLWEFALGGVLLLVLPLLRLPRRVAVWLGWLGLAGLVVCGAVFRGGDEFPGWAALWPTLAAALLIATAGSGSQYGVDRLLRTRPLRQLGSLSYALYLWHWPVLICYLAVTGFGRATLRGGMLVIAASVVLAIATRWLLELRLRDVAQRSNQSRFALGAACVAAILAVTAVWHGYILWEQHRQAPVDSRAYPGAAHLATGGTLPDVPYRPTALDASEDRPVVYDNGCHQEPLESRVLTCEFGPAEPRHTIALVGGSHSAHWLPALREVAEQHRWRIVSITKSSCRFDAEHQGQDPDVGASCREWNERLIGTLAELRPDAVLTLSTSGADGWDQTPDSYLTQWQLLDGLGITVLALRDIPWHEFDVPECVERRGPDAEACGGDRAGYGLEEPAAVASRTDVPENVRFLDLTDYLCDPEFCPAVVGNVLVYSDAHHLSATYSRTLAPFLADAILESTNWR